MATPVTIATGVGGAIGCDYLQGPNRLVFVEFAGKVSALELTTHAYHVLGTGYTEPEDIAVAQDGRHAYVTERSGNLLRVDLLNANRVSATVVAAGMTAPHQIALDEAHGYAYVVEFASPGRLLRIPLAGGPPTVLVNNLQNAIGLLMTSDFKTAYLTEQLPTGKSKLSRLDLHTGTPVRTDLVHSTTAPLFFMTWADEGESTILVPERDPANKVWQLDLTQSPLNLAEVASGVPPRPSSVAVTTPGKIVICSDSAISELDLTGGAFSAAGPIFLGIGFVPIDHINNSLPMNPLTDGYATTDPGYFFYVKDSPFGGTLPFMITHDAAYAPPYNARYYKVQVDGTEPLQSFNDYLWNGTQFVLHTTSPLLGGYYPVRSPGQLWYNHWLGYMLDTSGLSNGLHNIHIRLFHANGTEIVIPPAVIHNRWVRIDNGWPTASIDQIIHDGIPVDTCAIVKTGTDQFTFRITAHDPEQHLLSWSLVALWGDNKSGGVSSDDYNAHVSPSRLWAGISGTVVPPPGPSPWHATVAGDPTSRHCAHTFYLTVWDRVINGYNYLHRSDYHKSITIDIP
jgi:hypothetical protein